MHRSQRSGRKLFAIRAAFSLLELLTVIAIVVVILAIVFPALSSARTSAKIADTKNLMVNITQALTRFQTDKGRLPGYFTAKEMGSVDNTQARGFSTMQNALLDLSGGVPPTGSTAAEIVDGVGPLTDTAQQIKVNPTLIGSGTKGSKAYFQPPPRSLVVQDGSNGGDRFGADANKRIPELVDSFGTPILGWRIDEMAVAPVKAIGDFVAESSSTTARFYWGQNSAFLAKDGPGVGRSRLPMDKYSLLGGKPEPMSTAYITCLGGLLGSPTSPLNVDTSTAAKDVLPASARGQFTLHSAGPNSIYMSRFTQEGGTPVPRIGGDAAGAKLSYENATERHRLFYGYNFFQPGSPDVRRTDDKGAKTSVDIISQFDDIVMPGG